MFKSKTVESAAPAVEYASLQKVELLEASMRASLAGLQRDLNRIGAEVQKILLIPGLQEVAEVPPQTIPGKPAHYELKRK